MSIEKAHIETGAETKVIAEVMTPTQKELTDDREKMKIGLSSIGIEGHLYSWGRVWNGKHLKGEAHHLDGNMNGHEITFWEIFPDEPIHPTQQEKESFEKLLLQEGPLCVGSIDGHSMTNDQALVFRDFVKKYGITRKVIHVRKEDKLIAQANRELGVTKAETPAQALEDFFATFKT